MQHMGIYSNNSLINRWQPHQPQLHTASLPQNTIETALRQIATHFLLHMDTRQQMDQHNLLTTILSMSQKLVIIITITINNSTMLIITNTTITNSSSIIIKVLFLFSQPTPLVISLPAFLSLYIPPRIIPRHQ
jgi:hypothetical protein